MRKEIEVKFSEVKALVSSAFPGASSRRMVKVVGKNTYHVRDYWDGGSRDECRFIELATGRVMHSSELPEESRQKMGNPFNLPICDVNLSPGFCVVEHVIFRGKSLGYRIYVAPERFEHVERALEGDRVKVLSAPPQLLLSA